MDRPDEALVRAVTDAVLARIAPAREGAPRALLIGSPPAQETGFALVDCAPYDAVVIGGAGPGFYLTLSDDRVLTALLDGRPVYFDEAQLPSRVHRASRARALLGKLQSGERLLRQLGARPLPGADARHIVTAETARRLRTQGAPLPPAAVLTPLARDILEGKSE